jgi:potassium inwardly-rectifying channel subfamily J
MMFWFNSIKRIGGEWRKIYINDPFHTVINTRTSRIVAGIFIAYALIIFLFALAYLHVSTHREECHVGIFSLMEAYIFSLETIVSEYIIYTDMNSSTYQHVDDNWIWCTNE